MARSVLFQAHHLPFVILDKLFVMSKGFMFLTFEFILVGMALLSDSSAGSTYIDRLTRGDMFRNLPRNTSSDCLAKGARCTMRIGGTVGDKICEKNCCFCRCESDKPTFLLQERRCVEEQKLLRILEKQGNNQGCDYRFVVAAGSQKPATCKQKVLIAIDTTKGARNYSMKFCSWRPFTNIHQFVADGITDCSIVPSDSFYLFNETWFNIWAPDTATNQAVFKVYVEGKNTNVADILLEWTKDLPAVYAGLIFSLKLRCYKNNETINSCLFSKNRGAFNGSKPTFYPPTTLLSSTTSTTRSKTTASPTITTESNTNVYVLGQSMEEKELNVLVLVLAIVGALLLFILLCVSLLLLIQRRRRGDIEKFEPRENPVYQKGPSVSLKMKEIEGDEETSLPFIINDESHDQQNGVPASHRRSNAHGSSTPKDSVQQKGPSASDPDMYQSLITEGVTGGDYQVLLDDGLIEDQPDEDVHEYHVLESDGATSDSDSYSVETPPLQNRNNVSMTEKNILDDLLDDIHDYDEPDDIHERREPANGVDRDTNKIIDERRSGNEESTRLSGYDEPEIIISDEECDNTETERPEELPGTIFDPHDYSKPDA